MRGQSRIEYPPLQNGIGDKFSDDIEIYKTEILVKEVCHPYVLISNKACAGYLHFFFIWQVERVLDSGHPDPLEIANAKKRLKV